jgi:hypothetical protein
MCCGFPRTSRQKKEKDGEGEGGGGEGYRQGEKYGTWVFLAGVIKNAVKIYMNKWVVYPLFRKKKTGTGVRSKSPSQQNGCIRHPQKKKYHSSCYRDSMVVVVAVAAVAVPSSRVLGSTAFPVPARAPKPNSVVSVAVATATKSRELSEEEALE